MNQAHIPRAFPPELLERPIAERKRYFKDKIVAHRSITDALNMILSTLNQPIDGQIIMVIGAPGVGKTTVRQAMVRDVTAAFLAQPNRNPGHIPIAGIELEAFQNGIFKWKKTRQAMLQALHEPLVDKKIIYHTRMSDRDGELIIDTRISSDDLGEILVTVLSKRQPRALWFDEGQHLLKVSGAKGLLDQLDVIKSMANRSSVTPVLFGTYEMTALLGLSPQLDRRTRRIHIPRYKANNQTDVQEFQKVLLGFQKHLPFPVEPDLLEHWIYFFEGSLGCVGILKDWLYQAASDALEQEANTLTRDICDVWMQDRDVLVDMTARILAGEAHFNQKHSQIELRTLLGLPVDDVPGPINPSQTNIAPTMRKPGTRNPIRDKVGVL